MDIDVDALILEGPGAQQRERGREHGTYWMGVNHAMLLAIEGALELHLILCEATLLNRSLVNLGYLTIGAVACPGVGRQERVA